jgi:purine nucleosidase
MARKVLLDLDTGIDDAMAICEAVANPAFDLIGITGEFGNVSCDQGVRNSLAILHLLGQDDVPVYKGADRPLLWDREEPFFPPQNILDIHGFNGVGGADIPDSPRKPEEMDAVEAIIYYCRTYGSDLTIVATGPLTNLARAFEKDPEALKLAGNITIMGGAVATEGNVSPCAEANIANDPEAAKIVLESGLDIYLVGLDVTMKVILTKDMVESWRSAGPAGEAMADIVGFYVDAHNDWLAPTLGGCALHDPLSVAVAADPTLCTYLPSIMKVDLEGELRGRTIGNQAAIRQEPRPVKVALGVDAKRFEDQLMADIVKVCSR